MGRYVIGAPRATLVIYPDELSKVLVKHGGHRVDRVAAGAARAAAATRTARIRVVRYTEGATVKAEGFPLRSVPKSPLANMLRTPVALVTNHSFWARIDEYGSLRNVNRTPPRPMRAALNAGKAMAGVRAYVARVNAGNKATAEFVNRSRAARNRRRG